MKKILKYFFIVILFLVALIVVTNLNKTSKRYVLDLKKKMFPNIYKYEVKVSKTALKYLCGLNGVEIGASIQNGFRLTDPNVCNKIGAYANVDFSVEQGVLWQDKNIEPTKVNFVATGDKLPFKDNSLDYVLSSHMIEHAFDPIATINEWFRIVKKGGYIFMIIPHKDRTFDKPRDVTSVKELTDRHSGKIRISDYAHDQNKTKEGMSTSDHKHILIKNNVVPGGFIRLIEDDHHHWSVWKTQDFLDLCKAMKWNIVESLDVDDKIGNGFLIVLQK